jgi:metacaspase-1
MVILTDDKRDPLFMPTRVNIINALKWLAAGNKSGDSLFLHFSGHGSRVQDRDGDESDGYDETICPVDYDKRGGGQIVDDELNDLIVKPLQRGVRLTAVFDCCHSGSVLDLPITYKPDGSVKQSSKLKTLTGVAKNSVQSYMRGIL